MDFMKGRVVVVDVVEEIMRISRVLYSHSLVTLGRWE
jgi:hypothetical protein